MFQCSQNVPIQHAEKYFSMFVRPKSSLLFVIPLCDFRVRVKNLIFIVSKLPILFYLPKYQPTTTKKCSNKHNELHVSWKLMLQFIVFVFVLSANCPDSQLSGRRTFCRGTVRRRIVRGRVFRRRSVRVQLDLEGRIFRGIPFFR